MINSNTLASKHVTNHNLVYSVYSREVLCRAQITTLAQDKGLSGMQYIGWGSTWFNEVLCRAYVCYLGEYMLVGGVPGSLCMEYILQLHHHINLHSCQFT